MEFRISKTPLTAAKWSMYNSNTLRTTVPTRNSIVGHCKDARGSIKEEVWNELGSQCKCIYTYVQIEG